MALYTDKPPESCDKCLYCYIYKPHYNSSDTDYTCRIQDEMAHDDYDTLYKSCPLKELTNQQLAIGWFNEGHTVVVTKDYLRGSPLTMRDTIESINEAEWEIKEEKPQFTYTDWDGARKAINLNKKVTHDILLVSDYCTLLKTDVNTYTVVDKEGDTGHLTDHLYDSKLWKVWD